MATRKRKVTYPVPRTSKKPGPPPGVVGESTYQRNDVVAIDLRAGSGRGGLAVRRARSLRAHADIGLRLVGAAHRYDDSDRVDMHPFVPTTAGAVGFATLTTTSPFEPAAT